MNIKLINLINIISSNSNNEKDSCSVTQNKDDIEYTDYCYSITACKHCAFNNHISPDLFDPTLDAFNEHKNSNINTITT